MPDSAKPSGYPLEKRLDVYGDVIGAGSIVAAVAIFFWLDSQSPTPGTAPIISAVPSLAIVCSGAVAWLQLHVAAEVIRLLKRLNKLPYQGEISAFTAEGAGEGEVLLCSECGAELTRDSRACPKCGATLEQ